MAERLCVHSAPLRTQMNHVMRNYIRIARPDHWVKNIFMLPGVIFAAIMTGSPLLSHLPSLAVGFASLCLIASANYVINEYLDREFDKFHPKKKDRPSVSGQIKGVWVVVEYVLLAGCGLLLGAFVSMPFLATAAVLLVMGVLYNIRPFRTKDRVYVDVLSESVNNPLRLLMGWFVVTSIYLPPVSLLMAYWFGGSFLMAVKRFSEYRFINDPVRAGLYRQSFRRYTEQSLLISVFIYAMLSMFFLVTFLIKYRMEYLIVIPFIITLFAWYLRIGYKKNSAAQHPEQLFRERRLLTFAAFTLILFILLLYVEIPAIDWLLSRKLIPL